MKKSVLIALLALFCQLGYAQLDTIGKYPFLYHYNWPESGIIHDDTVLCNVFLSYGEIFQYKPEDVDYWNSFLNGSGYAEFAVYQHTDVPLNIIGLAIGNFTKGGELGGTGYYISTKASLYDSTMTELSTVSGVYYIGNASTDTNAHHFYFPGLIGLVPGMDMTNTPPTYVFYEFFGKEVSVMGDYYIGVSDVPDSANNFYGGCTKPVYMKEWHDEPYNFPDSYFKMKSVDGRWSALKSQRQFPVLFAILKLPCEPLDSVNVVVMEDGCLHVDWEAPEMQSSWTVMLTLPDGSTLMQPTDTNHWEYCGIVPGARYTVKVRSRCDDLNGYSWSEWSDGFSIGQQNPQAITETALPTLDVHPNPTDGTVVIPAEGIREVWCVAADGRRTQLVMKNGQVSLKDYPAGLYVLEIQTDEGLFTAKVVRK